MILAMVFLLFCTFVGSSVLVSATANAYRVNHLSDQQNFLTERSAALLLTDELQLEDDERLQLIVIDADLLYKEVNVGNGGVVTETGNTQEVKQITFQVTTNIPKEDITAMQTLQLEMAVWRALEEKGLSGENAILKNFPHGAAATTDDFVFKPSVTETDADKKYTGTIRVTATPRSRPSSATDPTSYPETNVTIPEYTASFTCGKGEQLYDFRVDFASHPNSQLKVNMDAFYGVGQEMKIESPARAGTPVGSGFTTGYYQLVTTQTQTVIAWDDPLLEKGDAA